MNYEHHDPNENNKEGEEEYLCTTKEEEEDLAEVDIDEDKLGDLEEAEADEPNPAFDDKGDEENCQQEEH